MKKIILTVLAAFSVVAVQAQLTLQMQNPPATVYGGYAQAMPLQATFPVMNTGSQALNIKVARKMISEVTGSENNFCWGVNCYPPFVSVSPDAETIAPQAVNNSFIADYTPNNMPGTTVIRYSFFKENSTDSIHTTIQYNATSAVAATKKDLNNQVGISAPSPNPARDMTFIRFNVPANSRSNKIKLFNAIGGLVKEISLNQKQGDLVLVTSQLPDGVYFYTLQSDNNALATKKLIVRH